MSYVAMLRARALVINDYHADTISRNIPAPPTAPSPVIDTPSDHYRSASERAFQAYR